MESRPPVALGCLAVIVWSRPVCPFHLPLFGRAAPPKKLQFLWDVSLSLGCLRFRSDHTSNIYPPFYAFCHGWLNFTKGITNHHGNKSLNQSCLLLHNALPFMFALSFSFVLWWRRPFNYRTKRVWSTRLTTSDPKNCPRSEDRSQPS